MHVVEPQVKVSLLASRKVSRKMTVTAAAAAAAVVVVAFCR